MAASATEICNMALSHLGLDNDISDLDTERSAEARACRKWYETVRDQVLRDFPWPFAKKLADLALITSLEDDEATHPTEEWGFQYSVPSDCLMVRRILSGSRNDARGTRIPYLESHGTSGTVIFTDMNEDDAVLEYTTRVEAVERYPADFVMALSLRLAAVIATQLTAGDPFKLGIQALQKYRMEISIARANAGNEEQPEEHPDAEWIRVRGE